MKIGYLSLILLSLLIAVPSYAADGLICKAPEGFVPLFNGKDLTGWWGQGTKSPHKWMTQDSMS